MTWQEFVDRVKAAGVKDEDEIWYIDIYFGGFELNIGRDNELGWHIDN